ncbi:MAG: monomeric sarcosine oxidase [Acidimicrobiaceae bacterium]|nr:monomeric sarcosine oxidase [Acidimicrobiaceae bacterium]|tara:strand:- start:3070 stop:4422 length:1353 start_codon:yes stop_codon:yes gene_type:complete
MSTSDTLPQSIRYCVIGAGIHGLSTAWHLARELKARGTGDGSDIVVIEKSEAGAGPSGIACGVVRNNYFQPAMRELMAHSVEVWEANTEAFEYHPVGYLQISYDEMRDDVATIHEQQQAIGYESVFIDGEAETHAYMKGIFDDWRATGVTSVLHEKKGGYAHNMATVNALLAKVEAEGVSVVAGTLVTELVVDGGAVTHVVTRRGTESMTIAVDHVVAAAGPWVPKLWEMLDLPDTTDIVVGDRTFTEPTWKFWALQEGTLGVDPGYLMNNDGDMPPVVHVDADATLCDEDGNVLVEGKWGIYYKPDFNFGGVQGGYMPYRVEKPWREVAIDPYGPASPDFIVGEDFRAVWAAALSHCQERFEGKASLMSHAPSGGIGAFTPDSFPVFDTFCDNVYVIADSNHGFKMVGVGALVARELCGDTQGLLEPFRYSRYALGKLHPESNSPYPWS